MPLETFLALEKQLTEYTLLKESHKQFSIRQNQQCFYIVGEGEYNQVVQEKSHHSGNTIFSIVLGFLLYLYIEIVNLSTKDDALHSQICRRLANISLIFKTVLYALDSNVYAYTYSPFLTYVHYILSLLDG